MKTEKQPKQGSLKTAQRFTTTQLTKLALMVAFVSAMSYIRIPVPLSDAAITGQTLAVHMLALLLTPSEAFAVMASYWLLGLVGVPVFGGMAGPGKLFGPGGGYFMAFMLAVVCIAKLRGQTYRFGRYVVITIVVSLVVINGIGFVWLKFVTGIDWSTAFLMGFVVFIPFDVGKCILACIAVKPIRRALQMIENGG